MNEKSRSPSAKILSLALFIAMWRCLCDANNGFWFAALSYCMDYVQLPVSKKNLKKSFDLDFFKDF